MLFRSTLLLPAIKYFSESGDSLYAERALYCKAHLDRRLYRMKDAMQSFPVSYTHLVDSTQSAIRTEAYEQGVDLYNRGEYVQAFHSLSLIHISQTRTAHGCAYEASHEILSRSQLFRSRSAAFRSIRPSSPSS